MPKQIYNNFTGGISDNDREGNYVMRDIDIFRDYGYLVPGFKKSDITITGQNQHIIEIIHDSLNQRAYLLGNSARIYCVDTSSDTDVGNTFGDGTKNYVIVSGMSEAKGLITYITQDSAYRVLFAYNGTNKDIAKGVLTNSWDGANLDRDWGSTVPTGGATLQAGRRDIIKWGGYIWITNGRYVGKLDTLAATPIFDPTFFDLGPDWTADRLFSTNHYLGIVASEAQQGSNYFPVVARTNNKCRIYLHDGVSSSATEIIPLEGINQIYAIINNNGNIILFADNRSRAHILGVLQENGIEEIKELRFEVDGTVRNFLSPLSQSAITIYKNKVLFGVGNNYAGLIFGYGRKDINKNYILYQPYSLSTAVSSQITSLKQVYTDKLYAGYFDGTNYKLAKLTSGYSTSATYKAGYTDAGQRIRINYVKFYFKPLVSGDSVTVSLDTDYGTSNPLRTISYAADGAITSIKKVKNIICHAFRPVIKWNAGGTAFSKIVVDFDYIND